MTNELIEQPKRENSLLLVIERIALDPNSDISKLEKMLEMQERIMAKQAEIDFNQAFSQVSKSLPRIKKKGSVDYKNKQTDKMEKAFNFARIEDIDEVIRPILAENGFSLSFESQAKQGDGGGIIVTGTLSHVGGHSRTASIPLALDSSGGKNNLQAMGSSFAYGRRYTTCMLLNIVTEGEDDDAQSSDIIPIEDAIEIEKLITDSKSDKKLFLKFMNVENVRQIKIKDYHKAIHNLKLKAKQVQA